MKNYCIILLSLMVTIGSSCSKREALADRTYYGEVSIGLRDLPGTKAADLYYDGRLLGSITPTQGTTKKFRIPVSDPAILALYESGTKDLIADTSISVQKNTTLDFSVANSNELGIRGWLSARPVAPDTFSFQLMNKLSDHLPEVVDLYIYLADPGSLDLFETGIIIRNFTRNQFYPLLINLPVKYLPDGNPMIYVGKMKEPGKDEWIFNEGLGLDLFSLIYGTDGAGKYGIYTVNDSQGYIETSPIYF